MEPVTHFLTGACLSRAGFNRRTAYATLAMTLAAEAPDLDVLWGLAGPVAVLQHHRGITHTFLGAPFVALAVTGVVYLWHRFRQTRVPQVREANLGLSGASLRPSVGLRGLKPNWFLIWLFSFIAVLSHLLLDFTNNYGLRPFFPFNPRWYAWDIVFIFEPLMFLALLGALILPAIFGLADREIGAARQPFRGRGWAIAALSFIAILYAVRNAEHEHALNLLRANTLSEPTLRVAAEPLPVNPFQWHGLAETVDFYQTASINTRTDSVDTDSDQILYKPPVTLSTLAAKRSWLGHVYLDWSKWPVVTDRGSQPAPGAEAIPGLPTPLPTWHTVEFRDLRFSDSPKLPGNSKAPPLSGWVYIGPDREVEAMILSGREQK
jgi:inner membrane protein